MASTGFWARDAGRLAANYLWIGVDGKPLDKPVPLAPIEKDGLTARPRLLSGGGGMVSSARDYARFVQMLLNEGAFNGRTIMPTGTARQALSNMMPLGQLYEGRNGFGAGGRLTLFDTRSGGEGAPAMLYGWGGAAGTLMAVDRVRQLGVVVMLQYMPQQRFPLEKDLARSLNRAADGR
jgi:CubicO group peptidase (beta-lactamase class C family)